MTRKLKNQELNRLSIEEFQKRDKIPLVIVLDNIRSMHNVGSVFRTSDAFLIEKVYLCGITAQPPHPEIHKTALGSTESVEWEYFDSTLDAVNKLKNTGYKMLAIEQAEGALKLDEFSVEQGTKYAVIMGNEVKGVQQEVVDACDVVVEIPQFGTKHSLNISVCTGVVIWDLYTKLKGGN